MLAVSLLLVVLQQFVAVEIVLILYAIHFQSILSKALNGFQGSIPSIPGKRHIIRENNLRMTLHRNATRFVDGDP